MTKQKTVGILRVAFGALGLTALTVGYDRDVHTGDAVNFFFYFTDLSNLFAAAVFVVGGIALLRGRPGVPDLVRGAAVLYLVITGLVYWTLLANTINAATIVWQNDIVHGVMPAALVLDWLVSPPATRLGFGKASRWLAFPILYLAVSLIRGPIVRWWPYDFLDPTQPGGYTHVTTWSFIVTGVFVVFMLLIVWIGNQLGSSSSGSPSSDRSFSTRSA
ncbi:MAG TPA: Pr6Pr family membrane protein [Actinospica sp.]|nr:Pr6Pr family membrane protein [Actinospica sp.]